MADDEVAVVTGSGSGIGAALAVELASRGVGVVLVGRRRAPLERTLSRFGAGEVGWVIAADIASPRGREAVVTATDQCLHETGRCLRYLVHNAGLGDPASDFQAMASEALREALEVNVIAPLALTQQLQPTLALSCDARVLMVGAGIADRPQPGTGSYGISKKALERLFEQMQVDWAREAIHSPSLALFQPGLVKTEGLEAHVTAAEAMMLPHADYLREALASGRYQDADSVAAAMADALMTLPTDRFHGATLRP